MQGLEQIMDASTPLSLPRTVALVGLMGAGKSAIGKRLALRLGLPFVDADDEIERAAGCYHLGIFRTIRRDRVPQWRAEGNPAPARGSAHVLSTGGGAYMDAETRALMRRHAITVWLRADLEVLYDRVRKRTHRPLLRQGDPKEILARLMKQRYPVYAEADLVVELDSPTRRYDDRAGPRGAAPPSRAAADRSHRMTVRTVPVSLAGRSYDILIGPALIDRAGELSAGLLASRRVIVVTDETVAPLYGARLVASFERAGIAATTVTVPAGESSKEFAAFGGLMNALLDQRPDRKVTLVALGGGVVGDLTGFAAASLLRGVDFIQVPTTLLAQVDSSVGGKTGINTRHGKNLIGAFYQPRLVLADTERARYLAAGASCWRAMPRSRNTG